MQEYGPSIVGPTGLRHDVLEVFGIKSIGNGQQTSIGHFGKSPSQQLTCRCSIANDRVRLPQNDTFEYPVPALGGTLSYRAVRVRGPGISQIDDPRAPGQSLDNDRSNMGTVRGAR